MNIALTGFMGTGKTVVGNLLADKLGWRFIDTDTFVEKNAEMSMFDIFAHCGEQNFRDRETQAIRQLSMLDKKVLSCGSRAVLCRENMDNLEKTSVIVCLTASPEVICQRLYHHSMRPFLKLTDPLKTIKNLLAAREPFYRRCSSAINTDSMTPDEIVAQICELCELDYTCCTHTLFENAGAMAAVK
ncbi:MAG: shikimate kinase [Endomicrobiales bacterium]|jgi:shikimate kinase